MACKKRSLLFSVGNLKIGPDTMIMNITSATDCPSRAIGLCQVPPGACYALRDEKRYKKRDFEGKVTGPLTYRRAQTRVWDTLSAEEIAEQVKDIVRRHRKAHIKYIRMQESGDFRDAHDVDKLSRVADLLKGTVKMYTYTARRDLFPRPHSSNLVINGSGFMVDNEFKVVNTDQLKAGPKCRAIYVPMDQHPCYGCTLCKTKGHKVIQETLRGSKKRVVPVELRGAKTAPRLPTRHVTYHKKDGHKRHARVAVNVLGGLR